jgi:hypothetical protein
VKIAFVVHNEHYTARVMQLLSDAGIDYYTRWEHTKGKGHDTEPHLGSGSFGAMNAVLMIAFREEPPLAMLIDGITAANAEIKRADDKIRLFQIPLERMV